MRKILISATIALLGSAAVAQASTVFSDDFESNSLGLNATPNGWTVNSGSVDLIGSPGFYEWYGPGVYVDMNGSTGAPGSISTTVSGLTVGQSYTLSFDVGYNNNSGNNEMLSFVIGTLTGSYGPPILSGPSTFLTLTYEFIATATDQLLTFSDTGPTYSDQGGPILDNVKISTIAPVPLPAAGLMLLAGLGGLAGLRRKRRA